LETAGIRIAAVRPPQIPEAPRPGEAAVAYARRLSVEKAGAIEVAAGFALSADTVVHLGPALFEKPVDDEEAARFLRALAGAWHSVTTAWCLRGEGRVLRGHRTSRVRFRGLREAEVWAYVATGEGRDKAGGYGIQGAGAALIDRVVGSHTNVVGLPLVEVLAALATVGIHPSGAA
jgi:septum formation protein